MSEILTGTSTNAIRGGNHPASIGTSGWLTLAAAPTFAIMTLISATHDGGPADRLCSAAHGGFNLGGMTAMYVLMSLFHSAPWLHLITARHRREAS